MKPGEMTAEELVREVEACAWVDGRHDEMYDNSRGPELRAELLARLNAGGSPEHFEMTPEIAAKGTLVPEAALPQPEVSKPPCQACGLPMKVKEWSCACGATTAETDLSRVENILSIYLTESSPQLEQVARLRELKAMCQRGECSITDLPEAIELGLEVLQRHFPGSEGAQCKEPGCKCKNQAEATCSFEFEGA